MNSLHGNQYVSLYNHFNICHLFILLLDKKIEWRVILLKFADDPVTLEEINAKEAIIQHGVEQGIISPNYSETKGLFYQYFGDSNPPEKPPYEPWKPPPCLEKEKTQLYKCSTISDWAMNAEEEARIIEQL